MSWDIKPGDQVVCIADSFAEGSRAKWMFWRPKRTRMPFSKSEVYDVSAVGWGHCPAEPTPQAYLQIMGFPGSWWSAASFRKVQRRDLSAWLETAAKDTDRLDRSRKRERVP